MPIYINSKIIFIHIPKNAGTSIHNYLICNNNTLLTCNNDIILSVDNLNDYHEQHYTYLEILNSNVLLEYEGYRFFAIVRNPYYKLISALIYARIISYDININDFVDILKIIFGTKPLIEIQKKGCTCKHINYYSFKFNDITYFLEKKHILSQSSFLKNKNNEIEKSINILYFENINDEIKNKLDIYNFDLHLNKSNILDTNRFLVPKVKKIIYEYYYEDFINFGYTF
jgi:hypothetical protein